MNTNQVTTAGAILFLVFTFLYIIVFFFIQHRLFTRRIKKAEQFCEQAGQDGRMVIAYRKSYHIVHNRKKNYNAEFIGRYYYTAPNGKQYKMKYYDCRFQTTPPETRTLYLDNWIYRKYYTEESLSMGKHGGILQILMLISGFLLYMFLFQYAITPFLY